MATAAFGAPVAAPKGARIAVRYGSVLTGFVRRLRADAAGWGTVREQAVYADTASLRRADLIARQTERTGP